MMKNDKRLMCMALVLVLLLSCGCVSNPGGVGGTTGPTTIPTTVPTIGTTAPATEPSSTGEAGGAENPTAPATEPTTEPTTEATETPTTEPTVEPTTEPTEEPTVEPTEEPTAPPSTEPSTEPPTEPPTEPTHSHVYTSEVYAPSCATEGYTVYTCECGDSYKDNYTKAVGHDYETEVVEPTTTSQGYTIYTCIECGYSYNGNYTEKLPEPTDPPCEHEYTQTNVDGTCLEEGHYLYECKHCGHTYKESNGQGWAEHYYEMTEFVDPTPEEDGYFVETCKLCGKERRYDIPYTPPETEAPELDSYEVAKAVAKYINQFRAEQGVAALEMLPGFSQVAAYRSVQLIDNYSHNTADQREAYAYYQYGEYVDMTTLGLPESENYYTAHAREAIGRAGTGNRNADELGKFIAEKFKASASHWAYVGSSEFSYIGVGCCHWGGEWYVCILVNTTNYG